MIHEDFIENLKTIDLVFYPSDYLLDGLIQKYGGRRIDEKSAVINFVYESKYVEGWPHEDYSVISIIIECWYNDFGIIRNSGQNYELIERLIVNEISHEIRQDTIFINQPCYGVTAKLANQTKDIFTKLSWNVTGIDRYSDKLFLYYLNLMCDINIATIFNK